MHLKPSAMTIQARYTKRGGISSQRILIRVWGGKFIYIGYQLGADHPVTSLDFKAYDGGQSNPPPGWSWSPQDLKQGAGGKFIYMLWKNDEPGKAPIMSIMLLVIGKNSPPEIPGYVAIHQDLNQGAGGDYIWPYYSTSIPFTAKTEALISKP